MPPRADTDHDATSLDLWFAEHIAVHEVALRSYLRKAFTSVSDIDDLVQETFSRVVAAKRAGETIHTPRGYVFAAARNAAIDLLRRRKVVIIDSLAEIEALPLRSDEPLVGEIVARRHDVAALREAIKALPDRCREILVLRKIEGLSQKEIAARLGITKHTVEVQVGLALKRCAVLLRRRGVTGERRE